METTTSLVRSLGADEVVDYLQEDFTKNGQTYDAIIDAVGKYSFIRGRRALKRGGVYVATDLGPFLLETPAMLLATRWVGTKRVKMRLARRWSRSPPRVRTTLPALLRRLYVPVRLDLLLKEDVLFLKELIEAGKFRAVIDRRYPVDELTLSAKAPRC